jgi:hypothetical protein
VLKFPAKRGRPPILVWDDKDVGAPVHDARGRGPPRVHCAVPLGVLRPRARGTPRVGVCVLFMFAARNSTYNYRLCPPVAVPWGTCSVPRLAQSGDEIRQQHNQRGGPNDAESPIKQISLFPKQAGTKLGTVNLELRRFKSGARNHLYRMRLLWSREAQRTRTSDS